MKLCQILQEIKKAWNSFPHYVKITEKGVFGPSTTPILMHMFGNIREFAKKENQTLEDLVFLDFGSGSGLVLASALAYGFGTVIGIEYDLELYELSKEHLAKKFKDDQRLILIKGDYLDPATYQHPIFSSNSFGNFIFYNYDDNNLKRLFAFWLYFFKGDGTFYCATFFDRHARQVIKSLVETDQVNNGYEISTYELGDEAEVLLVVKRRNKK
ncbi:class I SAM-dependent methyltransferase [Candidatus Woesearchaeota archaeon]|nr:class I SAM-dependent methyltransferase [Candidatus Woesearchaeota archaeon]